MDSSTLHCCLNRTFDETFRSVNSRSHVQFYFSSWSFSSIYNLADSLLASCEKLLALQQNNCQRKIPNIIFHCELVVIAAIFRSFRRIDLTLKFRDNDISLEFCREICKFSFGSSTEHIFGEYLIPATSRSSASLRSATHS